MENDNLVGESDYSILELMTLTQWRTKNKLLHQAELAEKLGVSQQVISYLEQHRQAPTIKFRRKFIEVFGNEEYDKIIEFK